MIKAITAFKSIIPSFNMASKNAVLGRFHINSINS